MTTARRFPFSPPSEQELSQLQKLEKNHSECSQRLLNAYLLNEHNLIKKYKEELETATSSVELYRAWLGLLPTAILGCESSCAKITKTLALYPPLSEQKLMKLKADLESDIQKIFIEAKTAITALSNDYSAENSVHSTNTPTRRSR